jgi:hypothetical protein
MIDIGLIRPYMITEEEYAKLQGEVEEVDGEEETILLTDEQVHERAIVLGALMKSHSAMKRELLAALRIIKATDEQEWEKAVAVDGWAAHMMNALDVEMVKGMVRPDEVLGDRFIDAVSNLNIGLTVEQIKDVQNGYRLEIVD